MVAVFYWLQMEKNMTLPKKCFWQRKYVDCCKQTLGATPPNLCEINECGKLEPPFTPSVDFVRGFDADYFSGKIKNCIVTLFRQTVFVHYAQLFMWMESRI